MSKIFFISKRGDYSNLHEAARSEKKALFDVRYNPKSMYGIDIFTDSDLTVTDGKLKMMDRFININVGGKKKAELDYCPYLDYDEEITIPPKDFDIDAYKNRINYDSMSEDEKKIIDWVIKKRTITAKHYCYGHKFFQEDVVNDIMNNTLFIDIFKDKPYVWAIYHITLPDMFITTGFLQPGDAILVKIKLYNFDTHNDYLVKFGLGCIAYEDEGVNEITVPKHLYSAEFGVLQLPTIFSLYGAEDLGVLRRAESLKKPTTAVKSFIFTLPMIECPEANCTLDDSTLELIETRRGLGLVCNLAEHLLTVFWKSDNPPFSATLDKPRLYRLAYPQRSYTHIYTEPDEPVGDTDDDNPLSDKIHFFVIRNGCFKCPFTIKKVIPRIPFVTYIPGVTDVYTRANNTQIFNSTVWGNFKDINSCLLTHRCGPKGFT